MTARIASRHVERIQALEKEGRITPAEILADAKQPESPLHDLYDWDVTQAAEAHWLDRTREIIRSIKVNVTIETRVYQLPRYVESADKPAGAQGYRTLASLTKDPPAARRALEQEFARVVGTLQRARDLAIALGLETVVEDLLARVQLATAVLNEQTEGETTQATQPAM